MSRQEVTTYRNTIDLGLIRMRRLCEQLSDPQDKIPVIQIAGTNGKGSTGVFLRNILINAGLRVGHYSSPAVMDAMEIITVDGQNISPEDYERLRGRVLSAAIYRSDDVPTAFETETAMAYLYFVERGCDVVIAEAGLGGDLDATNVTDATIESIITPIGLDHTKLLGRSVREIASHKAGIIKPGSIVISAPQVPDALEVIRDRARSLGCSFYEATDELGLCEHLSVPYQRINAMVAQTAATWLRMNALLGLYKVRGEEFARAIIDGIENMQMPGRMERISDEPVIIIDGAHNPPAAKALRQALDENYPDAKHAYVFGAFRDKDYMKVFKTVYEGGPVYLVTAPGQRGMSASDLLTQLNKEGITEAVAVSMEDAVGYAYSQKDRVVVAFGSLSWLADFRGRIKSMT
ncbi:MAG: bifunctional folylpolyglutamate synthase/dihydrofolate synthase [Lachnospiraceae bacterium]|nr:bifunctional folylpolyglutamate synthase/dihydrofolate synthase [Lachnospiraceae bacterium]